MSSLADAVLDHYRELVDFLARRTGSRDIARDCAQDTWLRLAGARPATEPANHRAYVFRVAANIAMDWHRRCAREQTVLGEYAAGLGEQNGAPDTLEIAALRQTLRRLEATIAALPPRSVEVFVLHKLDGLSYAQTAASLGISVSAVEKHMMRVLLACHAVLPD